MLVKPLLIPDIFGYRVVEVGVPAEHLTTLDHEMELPTPNYRPDREWDGQKFVCSRLDDAAVWEPWRVPGFETRDTGVEDGTKGVAAVRIVRPITAEEQTASVTSHDSDILFTFVLSGSCTLHGEGQDSQTLSEGDAYTLPPGHKTCLADPSADLSLLEVSLPGRFNTTVHPNEKLPI
ncbi:hypothetical protein ONZ43_g6493 [Nemania bipapillata]|uniref:Uncharacterized protein n=1 Tax=Nemania bipapillata TaxID=110536 RepID=A0ACC2HZL3_9PEZI|nr:hypothetical protein ONZ43_g6493 [Nemania bipapillata]